MNDLRSPSEDRPYRPSAQSPRLAQDDVDPEYGMSTFERIRYSRWFPLASVFAAVLIFSGIVSYAYKQGSQTDVNATTPVIAADTKDYKEKPVNPGGMDVPFQDAVVFDQLQNKDQAAPADGKVESLLPSPEQPVASTTPPAAPAPGATPEAAVPAASPAAVTPPVETPASPAAATTTAATEAPTAPAVETPAPEEAPAVAETLTPPTEQAAPAPVAKPAPVKKAPIKKAVVATATPAPKVTAAPKTEAGSYRIQLGAFRDESAARAAWSKVEKQYSALAGVAPAFPRADLGAKGIFYRAQGTNLSKASADNLCKTINAGKAGSCIVTH